MFDYIDEVIEANGILQQPRIFNPGSGAFAEPETLRLYAIGGARRDDGGESHKKGPKPADPPATKCHFWEPITSYAKHGVYQSRKYTHFESQPSDETLGLTRWSSAYLRTFYL